MRILFNVIFSLILVQQHVIASTIFDPEQDVDPKDINPKNFFSSSNNKFFSVTQNRNKFLGQEKKENQELEDTCGQTCTGPNLYPFGFLACLRTAFEKDTVMPRVDLSTSEDVNLPKVVFSPSTSLDEFDKTKVDEYNTARLGYGLASRLPSAILFAETTEDVVKGVNCARVNGYSVTARGRGHDYGQGVTLDGSLVIDMQLNCIFKDFDADTSARGVHNEVVGSEYIGRMSVPSGCTNAVFLAAVNSKFKKEGGMNVLGSCPSVGVTGFLLNGGYGDQTPWIGLGSDVVDEIEMVLYNGKHITASSTENEEIFWASKGGTGGIGIITKFWARIIKNPSRTKKFVRFLLRYDTFKFKDDGLENQVEILMRFQEFLAENDESRFFGGRNQYTGQAPMLDPNMDPPPFFEGAFLIEGTFLGDIKEMIDVFFRAKLLDPIYIKKPSSGDASFGGTSFDDLCIGVACQDRYVKEFPAFGLTAFEYKSQAEAQAVGICLFLNADAMARTFSFAQVARGIDICDDLNIDSTEYCEAGGAPNLDFFSPKVNLRFISSANCFSQPEVINAFVRAAKDPQGFLNRKGFSNEVFQVFNDFKLYPNTKALGEDLNGKLGQGTGGLILPKLQRKTIRALLRDTQEKFSSNHLTHGAPLTISPDADGYPHRNAFWNGEVQSRTPEYMNILLQDTAFQGDPINIQIYGNYNPSGRTPNYERHVYVDKVEELSRIRTKFDTLGGFDSSRYPQRNRSLPRTVPTFPIDSKSGKKDKKKKKSDKKEKKKKTK